MLNNYLYNQPHLAAHLYYVGGMGQNEVANRDGSPSDTSRAHQIKRPLPGWRDIAGGKLTTHRLMPELADYDKESRKTYPASAASN